MPTVKSDTSIMITDNIDEHIQFPSIVTLNVGGRFFTTRLATLRRCETSMLAAMFSGRHFVEKDPDGRYFIDREGTYFEHILNFLRHEEMPPLEIAEEVHGEALFYGIDGLAHNLAETPKLFGKMMSRDKFVQCVPDYDDKLTSIVGLAKKRAKAEDKSEVVIGQGLLAEHTCNGSHFLERVDIRYETCPTDFHKLIKCIEIDLKTEGYNIEVSDLGRCTYRELVYDHDADYSYEDQCRGLIYKFTFSWW